LIAPAIDYLGSFAVSPLTILALGLAVGGYHDRPAWPKMGHRSDRDLSYRGNPYSKMASLGTKRTGRMCGNNEVHNLTTRFGSYHCAVLHI
jgi:hypothetical protein